MTYCQLRAILLTLAYPQVSDTGIDAEGDIIFLSPKDRLETAQGIVDTILTISGVEDEEP